MPNSSSIDVHVASSTTVYHSVQHSVVPVGIGAGGNTDEHVCIGTEPVEMPLTPDSGAEIVVIPGIVGMTGRVKVHGQSAHVSFVLRRSISEFTSDSDCCVVSDCESLCAICSSGRGCW